MKNLHVASSLLQGLQVLAVPFAVAALFLWHFVAFLTLVLNCLKELPDWQLLGNMNWVLDSPICSDTNPLCSCFMVGTSLLTCVSFSRPCLQTWEHRRVVYKLKSLSQGIFFIRCFGICRDGKPYTTMRYCLAKFPHQSSLGKRKGNAGWLMSCKECSGTYNEIYTLRLDSCDCSPLPKAFYKIW